MKQLLANYALAFLALGQLNAEEPLVIERLDTLEKAAPRFDRFKPIPIEGTDFAEHTFNIPSQLLSYGMEHYGRMLLPPHLLAEYYLENSGIRFPEGSEVSYDYRTKQLYVKAPISQVELIDAYFCGFLGPDYPKRLLIHLKAWEVSEEEAIEISESQTFNSKAAPLIDRFANRKPAISLSASTRSGYATINKSDQTDLSLTSIIGPDGWTLDTQILLQNQETGLEAHLTYRANKSLPIGLVYDPKRKRHLIYFLQTNLQKLWDEFDY
ncbi:MAG: hypothetical protein AAF226_10130 [Verrucomicrobiota bacterium]